MYTVSLCRSIHAVSCIWAGIMHTVSGHHRAAQSLIMVVQHCIRLLGLESIVIRTELGDWENHRTWGSGVGVSPCHMSSA